MRNGWFHSAILHILTYNAIVEEVSFLQIGEGYEEYCESSPYAERAGIYSYSCTGYGT